MNFLSIQWQPSPGLLFGAFFVFCLVNYFVIVFFNTALVGAATIRLQGGDPTLRDGLQLAWARKWVIFQWALLAATVGMILRMIEGRSSLTGKLIAGLIGLAWTLASFLVVPILSFEELGPSRHSAGPASSSAKPGANRLWEGSALA